ncbi:MAG TPA: hypothetical protein VGQ12_18250 [Candidatus Angelobacter sp.]|jgi:hypothetical protein|nr:hypothetical protein [Candidatus Angelobacter sp.]
MSESMKAGGDFEWLAARAACSPVKVFEQLRMQITQDVELRNKMCEKQGWKFAMHNESAIFAVFLDSTAFHRENPYRIVRFRLEDRRIMARYGDDTDIFIATLTLNDDGECRLRIKDKNYELWQVRHMALERLFFEVIGS